MKIVRAQRVPGSVVKEWRRAQQARKRSLIPQEAAGRKHGKAHGSYIDDLAQLRKAIVLCWECQPKFDKGSHQYHSPRWAHRVNGKCDACKRRGVDHKLFLHQSLEGLAWSER